MSHTTVCLANCSSLIAVGGWFDTAILNKQNKADMVYMFEYKPSGGVLPKQQFRLPPTLLTLEVRACLLCTCVPPVAEKKILCTNTVQDTTK
eukprot:1441051-Amphidinium_carterae.1